MDHFYELPQSKAIELFKQLEPIAKIWIEQIVPGSYARSKCDWTFDQCIQLYQSSIKIHTFFINRINDYQIETGFCTLAHTPEIFMFMRVPITMLPELVQQFNLKPLK